MREQYLYQLAGAPTKVKHAGPVPKACAIVLSPQHAHPNLKHWYIYCLATLISKYSHTRDDNKDVQVDYNSG